MVKKKESKYINIRVLKEDSKLARKMLPSFNAKSMRELFHSLVLNYWITNELVLPIVQSQKVVSQEVTVNE